MRRAEADAVTAHASIKRCKASSSRESKATPVNACRLPTPKKNRREGGEQSAKKHQFVVGDECEYNVDGWWFNGIVVALNDSDENTMPVSPPPPTSVSRAAVGCNARAASLTAVLCPITCYV